MASAELKTICTRVRRNILEMLTGAASGHAGGSLSMVEILVALYFCKMRIDPRNPQKEDRDYFILSKGHAAPAYYAVLGERGYFRKEEFRSFRQLHSILQGHPDSRKCPGVDVSTGSLGQGLSIGVGVALGHRLAGRDSHVYVACGDGELQEGMIWEAFMAASHYGLDNLTVLIDNNGLQIDGPNDEVMCLGDIEAKLTAFGCRVIRLADGHDIDSLLRALDEPSAGKPKVILCRTVKGKGVSFMENQVGWHGKAPTRDECELAVQELEELA